MIVILNLSHITIFSQEIDDELLIISDTLPGNVKWKKVNPFELQEFLLSKIDEGFTFPINPKWILASNIP